MDALGPAKRGFGGQPWRPVGFVGRLLASRYSAGAVQARTAVRHKHTVPRKPSASSARRGCPTTERSSLAVVAVATSPRLPQAPATGSVTRAS
jgi:hypothetical protein